MAKMDDELDVGNERNNAEQKSKKSKKKEKEEESAGSKLVSMLIVIVIVLIWLGLFAAVVKADLFGFGSGVLAPVLKDVPVVNKILPEGSVPGNGYEEEYDFDSMDEAIDRIKELEMMLDSENSSNGVDSKYISELESEVERLQVFEKEQLKFAKEKKEFDENVVYTDNAPKIEEYKKYYEQMNPDNAAEIYRQVVEQIQASAKVKEAADRYAEMEATSAAQILDEMTSADLDMVCQILAEMDPEKSALILQSMDSNVAAKITKRMITIQ